MPLSPVVHSHDKFFILANSQSQSNRHKTNAITPSIGGIKNNIPRIHSIFFALGRFY